MSNNHNRLGEHYNRYSHQNISEYNDRQFRQNDYNKVYDQNFNQQYSVMQEPDIQYEKNIHYLTISSRDRDQIMYPNVNSYTIHFPNELKNVEMVELIQGIIPDVANVQNEPYLLLKIDEIQDTMISNDKSISNAFAMLQLAPPTKANTFIQLDRRIHEYTVKYYQTPKAYLSKMSITITDANGVPFNFGSDPVPFNKALQNTFVFKITTLEKKRTTLNTRGVYG